MTNTFHIAVFHGDGIGPEIMDPTLKILRQVANASTGNDLSFTIRLQARPITPEQATRSRPIP